MEMTLLYNIVLALAGIGVLLFGVRTLNQGLESILGVKFKKNLTKISSNKIKSYGIGAGVTTIVQSGTLTTSMVTGFINTGTMSLGQGLSIILGSNLGSALALVLIAFESISLVKVFCIFCLVGALLYLITKKGKYQRLATAFIGFGLLCLGITLIGQNMEQIVQNPSIYDFLSTVTNPVALFLIGLVICFATDSLYATIAIIIPLVGTVAVPGPLGINSAVIMLLGACFIGGFTTLVYNISGTSIDGKRALCFHMFFKMFASVLFIFLTMIPWVNPMYELLGQQTGLCLVTLFVIMMLLPSLLMLPFTEQLATILRKVVRTKKSSNSVYDKFTLDDNSVKIFGLAYTWLVECLYTIIKMEADLTEKLIIRITDKNVTEQGLSGKIKALDKIIKLMMNNIIRISANQSENNLDKMNIALGIINDENHLLERIQKIYNYDIMYKEKPRSMSSASVETLMPMWVELRKSYDKLYEFMEQSKDLNEKSRNIYMTEIFKLGKLNIKYNNQARTILTSSYKMKGVYTDDSLYLNILLAYENINTDIENIAIKFGILES